MEPKYPNIEVELSGQDGNAFMIVGRVQRALRNAGVDKEEITRYVEEATSGDYDNVIQTSARWVEIY